MTQPDRQDTEAAGGMPVGLRLEYETLRREIQARIDIEQKDLVGCLAILSLLAGWYLTEKASIAVPYVCVVVYFAAMQRLIRGSYTIRRIASYLRIFVEPHLPGVLWETRLQRFRRHKHSRTYWGFGFGEWGLATGASALTILAIGIVVAAVTQELSWGHGIALVVLTATSVFAGFNQVHKLNSQVRRGGALDQTWLRVADEERMDPPGGREVVSGGESA